MLRRIAALKKELTVPGDSDVLHRSQLVRLNGRQAGLHRALVTDAVPDLNHHLRPLFIGAVRHGDLHPLALDLPGVDRHGGVIGLNRHPQEAPSNSAPFIL